ncbi:MULTISPECIES: phospholipase D-like domain-containing protein [unclassified Pedobacter]|uniref:phospholipase D-like domain-containing protein n=1 Tax=unclassified Pedobacter TaxID=2628915 RepID=UPI001E5B3040|nr:MULTISPECIES: phospholipase D-like domain-containing protein [unclassified Pedobacter]
MLTENTQLDQQVLQDNKEIFARIVKELEGADFEILIASAWFTDEELFAIVKSKAAQNVKVELIIADNQENLKLDFDELVSLGASVTKIKNVGYGIMNQKFCVIDKRIALHGSYNWSVNARKNNHESIIVTNHAETVAHLITNFNDINHKAALQRGEVVDVPFVPLKVEAKTETHTAKEHAISEFTKVLDSMIAAEIGNFDRSMLRGQGYERSKYNNGDHQVLTKSLDTVYSVFINDIDVVEDKKKRLKTKIDEQEVKSLNTFEENLNLQLQTSEAEAENETSNAKNQLINLKAETEKNKQEIQSLKENKIGFHEKNIAEIKNKIRIAQTDFVSPKFKWYEFIPVLFANICLITYLFIFYSSACYILLFAVEDSKAAKAAGFDAIPMEIFNPKALSLTLSKGGAGIIFILLFVSIPLFCALIKLFTKKTWIIISMFLVGIVLVDTAIAYKVSAAIYQMKYDIGDATEAWRISMAFTDPNFYLVFLLGAFGLLMLKFAFEKLMLIFEERNPDVATLKNNLLIKQMDEDLKLEGEKILLFKGEIYAIEAQNISLDAQYKIVEARLTSIPNKLNLLKEVKKTDLITGKQHIIDIATIYKSHVENDNLPISIDSLNDRINIFLEGWNDYLHEEYAVLKATEKSREAFDTAVNWQNEKVKSSQIDKRVVI